MVSPISMCAGSSNENERSLLATLVLGAVNDLKHTLRWLAQVESLMAHKSEYDAEVNAGRRPQCSANNVTGERCISRAIYDQSWCPKHASIIMQTLTDQSEVQSSIYWLFLDEDDTDIRSFRRIMYVLGVDVGRFRKRIIEKLPKEDRDRLTRFLDAVERLRNAKVA